MLTTLCEAAAVPLCPGYRGAHWAQKGWKTRLRSHSQLYHDLVIRAAASANSGPQHRSTLFPTHPPPRIGGVSWRPFTAQGSAEERKESVEHLWAFRGEAVGWATGATSVPGGAHPVGPWSRWGDSPGCAQNNPVSPGYFFQCGLPGEILIAESNTMLWRKRLVGSGVFVSPRKAFRLGTDSKLQMKLC